MGKTYPVETLDEDSPSWDQIVVDPSSDVTFDDDIRGVLCNKESTIRYRNLAGKIVVFKFPVGTSPVMMKIIYSSGSTFAAGDVLALL